ncbi:hypothetical protein GJU40_10630 [Bacillus lacus]|uniref:Uncharacterized protein n=1 Tax=Metabacillus lacus TaxID=1983721 RepID=A0A7X2IZD5_9BACI|nr:hypothetical protein [Metabacillus lacus]MRX72602.1 hypothetical protein [Metabacillus lacus]
MYKKLCIKCSQPSYSSCNEGKWVCPVCTNDLTERKAIVTSHQEGMVTRKGAYITISKERDHQISFFA